MAVPKGKVSKARRDKRRSSHWKLETPGIVTVKRDEILLGGSFLWGKLGGSRLWGQQKGAEQ